MIGSPNQQESISIHAPREGGDGNQPGPAVAHPYFNPRPPRGGRPVLTLMTANGCSFQSTPPARGATLFCSRYSSDKRFQSTPPARGATLNFSAFFGLSLISIHAPREGGDDAVNITPDTELISIHAPREGGDAPLTKILRNLSISIHAPREGGDWVSVRGPATYRDFNPRPPRGGRPPFPDFAPLPADHFNPRPPRGGRRRICSNHGQTQHFNPRPPRGGRRGGGYARWWGRRYFNPRPPRGGRQPRLNHLVNVSLFQSTPPARGATLMLVRSLVCGLISIHAPREGGDFMVVRVVPRISFISIHAPREGGDGQTAGRKGFPVISIHAPREGGDCHRQGLEPCGQDFNPRPPRGGRRFNRVRYGGLLIFQSTPPARGATCH